MADSGVLTCDFDTCRTIADTNRVYKELIAIRFPEGVTRPLPQEFHDLGEEHRKAMARIIDARDDRPTPTQRDATQPRSRDVRNWARFQGVPLAKKGKVPASVVNDYCVAHGLPVPDVASVSSQPSAPVPTADVTPADVRTWARSVGIEVGSRGRVHPDVIQRYLEAH